MGLEARIGFEHKPFWVVTFQSHVFRNAAAAYLAFGHGLTDDTNVGLLSALELLTDGISKQSRRDDHSNRPSGKVWAAAATLWVAADKCINDNPFEPTAAT